MVQHERTAARVAAPATSPQANFIGGGVCGALLSGDEALQPLLEVTQEVAEAILAILGGIQSVCDSVTEAFLAAQATAESFLPVIEALIILLHMLN